MNCPFTKKRILSLALVLVMLAGILCGCFGKEPDPTDGSGPNPGLELIDPDDTLSTEPEDTEPEETLAQEVTAYAIGQVNVLRAPGTDAQIIGYLSDGDQVQIMEITEVYGVEWARIKEGWVAMEKLSRTSSTGTEDPGTTDPDSTEPDTTEPEETKPEEKPGVGTTKLKGVVVASELNIRKDGNANAEKVGSYTYGARIEILEVKNGWGRTDKGWISMTYVYQDGTTGDNSCKGIVTGTQLNVRSGPGADYDRVATYNSGDRVEVLQTIKLGDTTWGCTKDGWISMGYVYVDGTKGENSGTGTMTGDNVNIRSGPGTNYDRVGSLNKGAVVEILHRVKVGNTTWGCIDKGWISMDYVEMDKQ